MALIGLRMMPMFPSPPLKSRTVGFPQYGFKASTSDDAFPDECSVKPAPGIPSRSLSLRRRETIECRRAARAHYMFRGSPTALPLGNPNQAFTDLQFPGSYSFEDMCRQVFDFRRGEYRGKEI